MNSALLRRDEELVERAVDGALTPAERSAFEARMAGEPELRSAYEELTRLRSLVQRRPTLGADPYFWTRLSARLNARKDEEKNLLPFPRRYVPLIAGSAVVAMAAFGFWVLQNRVPLLRFWERQSTAVQQAYQQTLAQSSLVPFFANLDPDRTLQFALYGSLQFDDEKGTTLRVDDQSANGYRIELKKESPRRIPKVTMSEFLAEIRPTAPQRLTIDSVLSITRDQLQSSVLVGSNDVVAINADLSRLNKAVVSGIAACLEPEQRVRLNRLLEEREAQYLVVNRGEHAQAPDKVYEAMRAAHPKREFVVLTPESLMLTHLEVDLRNLQGAVWRDRAKVAEMAALRARALERLVGEWDEELPPVIAPEAMPRVTVRTRRDRFTIRVQTDSTAEGTFFHLQVVPRMPVGVADSEEGVEISLPGETAAVRGTMRPAQPSRVMADSAARPERPKVRKPFPVDIRQ